ncbi:MAG: invasion associated locus B family protein [Pseudomonadota bacterium]
MQQALMTALVTGLGLTAGTALAQEKYGSWLQICEEGQPCRAVQQLAVTQTGEFAARIIGIKVEDGLWLAAQVPMGVYFPAGAVFKVNTAEDTPQEQMIWQRCLNGICEAAIQLDSERLEDFSQADQMYFAYRMRPDEDPRLLNVSLDGFIDALEAPRSDPPEQ